MRLNPNNDASAFPKRRELPHVAGTPEGAAWFWGGSDEVSYALTGWFHTLNL